MREIARADAETLEALRAYASEQERLRHAQLAEISREIQTESELYAKVARRLRRAESALTQAEYAMTQTEFAKQIKQLSVLKAKAARRIMGLHKERVWLLELAEAQAELKELEAHVQRLRSRANCFTALALGESEALRLRQAIQGAPYLERLRIHRLLGDRFKAKEGLRILRKGEILSSPLADATNQEYTETRVYQGKLYAEQEAEHARSPRQQGYFRWLATMRVVLEPYAHYIGKGGLAAFQEGNAEIPTLTAKEARKLFRGLGLKQLKPTPQQLLTLRESLRQEIAWRERLLACFRRRLHIKRVWRKADATAFAMPLTLAETNPQERGEL